MKVIIQKHHGEFANINMLTAYLGFVEKGYFIEFFEYSQLATLNLDDDPIVVGGIPVVRGALERMGIVPPAIESVPQCLAAYARRKTWVGVLGEARQAVDENRRVFVKPISQHLKLFNGQVVENYRDLAMTAALSSEHPVILSEPVAMQSEYRVFVLHGEIIGCRHYKGDFRLFPDFQVIDAAIRDFEGAPSGYGIDFAVTNMGETVLVEVNEGFALGCYGLPALRYSSIIEARWADFLAMKLPKL
jgi:hypothetical protein